MYNDLQNSGDRTEISIRQVKAYPSVYSPNNGSFNSEQNLKQLVKSVVTKPFIIGDTEQEVADSFKLGSSSFGIYTGEGMFNINGYTFKLAPHDDLSYDKPLNPNSESATVIETMHIQRFVRDLCAYGKPESVKLPNLLEDFVYDKYNPMNGQQTLHELQSNWKNALDDEKTVGYVRIAYTDTYATDFTIETSSGKQYLKYSTENKTDKVLIVSSSYSGQPLEDPTTGKMNMSVIENFIENNSDGLTENDRFAYAVTGGYKIFYPIKIKNDVYGKCSLTFTDIFGIVFAYESTTGGQTKLYPSTKSLFIDIDSNKPLNDIGWTDDTNCKLKTLPNKLYKFTELYKIDKSRKSIFEEDETVDISIFSGTDFPSLTDIKFSNDSSKSIFEKKTFDDIKTIFPDEEGTIHRNISNTLSYYCINVPVEDRLLYNGQRVPVAFMTSEGSLCPNGLIYDDGGTAGDESYPIEGYLQFLKRKYNVSDINELCTAINNDKQYYNYVEEALSVYLSLCYSSIYENVIVPEFDQSTDYKNIKSIYSGKKLSTVSSPDISNDTFGTFYNYQYTGQTFVSGTYVPTQKTAKIRFNWDSTSDNYKIQNALFNSYTNTLVYNDNHEAIFSYIPTWKKAKQFPYKDPNMQMTDSPLYFDDPANYLSKCCITSGNYKHIDSIKLKQIGQDFVLVDTGFIYSNVYVDDYLMPKLFEGSRPFVADTLLATTFNSNWTVPLSGVVEQNASLTNSACYNYFYPTWNAAFDYTVSIKKDGHDYLCGRNVDDPDMYDGLEFQAKLPQDVESNELYLCKLLIQSDETSDGYNNEKNRVSANSTSGDIPVRRGAYIHKSKIYGDNYESFDELVENCITSSEEGIVGRVTALESDVGELKQTVGDENSGLVQDVSQLTTDVGQLGITVGDEESGLVHDVLLLQDSVPDLEEQMNGTILGTAHESSTGVYKEVFGYRDGLDNEVYGLDQLVNGDGTVAVTDYNIEPIGVYKEVFGYTTVDSEDNPVEVPALRDMIESVKEATSLYNNGLLGQCLVDSGTCGTDLDYVLELSGWLRIRGTGTATNNYTTTTAPFKRLPNARAVVVNYVTIPDTLTGLGNYFFYDSSVRENETFQFSTAIGITSIGNYCFKSSGVTRVTVTSDVLIVGNGAFSDCYNLTYVFYDAGTIPTNAFYGDNNLEDVILGPHISEIQTGSFVGCSKLTTIAYQGTVSEWNNLTLGSGWFDTDYLSTINCSDKYLQWNGTSWEEKEYIIPPNP